MAKEEPKPCECSPGAPLWMCTFSDMMSLLLCFFILLLSFSVMDQKKYYQVAGSLKDAFGTQKEKVEPSPRQGEKMISADFDTVPLQVQLKIARVFSEEIATGAVDSEYSNSGLILRVKGAVAFESGSAEIKKEFFPFLDKLGKLVDTMDLAIDVSGHTDNVPLKKGVTEFHSNWELSAARAVNVVEYWIEKMKIPPDRLLAVAAADGKPIAKNDTPEGRAINRRVEFLVRPANSKIVLPEIDLKENKIDKIKPIP